MNCCRKNVEAFVNLYTYCNHYGQLLHCEGKKKRQLQDSNLRGQSPKDF